MWQLNLSVLAGLALLVYFFLGECHLSLFAPAPASSFWGDRLSAATHPVVGSCHRCALSHHPTIFPLLEPASYGFGFLPTLSRATGATPLLLVIQVSQALLAVVCFSLYAFEGGRQGASDLVVHTPFFVLPACLLDSPAVSLLLLWIPVYLANLHSAVNRGTRYQSYCEKPRVRQARNILLVILALELLPLLPWLDHSQMPWRLVVALRRSLWIPFVALNAHPTPKKSKVIKETNATRRLAEFYTYLGGVCTVAHLLAVGNLLFSVSVSAELGRFEVAGAWLRAVAETTALAQETPVIGAALRVGLAEVGACMMGLVLLQLGEGFQSQVPLFLVLSLVTSPAGAFCFFMIHREQVIRGPVKIRKAVPSQTVPIYPVEREAPLESLTDAGPSTPRGPPLFPADE